MASVMRRSSSGMRPYLISAAFARSVSRSTFVRSDSSSSFRVRMAPMASRSASQWRFISSIWVCSPPSSSSSASRRSRDAVSVSFSSATFSISSCRARRWTTSISVGSESISMRSLLAASSIRSIALSGRKRFVRYRLESTAALTSAESWMRTPWCTS